MAETAESVIIAIEAQMNTAAVTQGTQVVTGAMSEVERSANRAETAVRASANKIVESHTRMGASGMELQHVIRGTADQFAAGAPLIQIFSQHIAMLGEAAALSGSSMGRFGAVMAGPWGIAITAGIAVLATMISRIGGTTDALNHETEKLQENARHTDLTRTAQEIWAHTIPGVIEAIRAQTEALEEQNRSLAQNQQLALDQAQSRLANARALLAAVQAELPAAQRELQTAQEALNNLRRDPGLTGVHPDIQTVREQQAATDAAQARVARLTAEYQHLQAALAQGEQGVRDALVPIAERQAEALSDPIARITQHYDALRDAAVAAAHGNDRLTASLAQTIATINLHRDAELDAERARQRAAPREHDLVRPAAGAVLSQFGADRSGVPLNGRLIAGRRHKGVDIRGNIGDPVVAPEGGVARVLNAPGGLGLYIEIRADSGARDLLGHLSAANIRSRDRVTAGQLVGLIGTSGNARGGTPHLHFQRQVNGQWVDPMRSIGSSGAAQEAQQQANLERADEEKFRTESARLDTEILQARRRRVETEDEATAADLAAITAEQAQRDERIRHEADERTRRDATQTVTAQIEAGLLLAKSAVLAATQRTARLSLDEQRHAEERITIAMSDIHDAESILQAHAALARAIGDRRDIELRLLDLQHQEEILAIQKQRAQQNLDADQRAQLDRQEATSNERYGLARQGVIRQNRTPLEQFFADVPRTAQAMNEAFQNVELDGLQAFNNGLDQAISRFHLLGGVADQVLGRMLSDILQLVLRQGELAAFGGGRGGFFGSLLHAFGLGGSGAYAGELLPGSSAVLPGFASGGAQMVGGAGGIDSNIVSINGRPRFRASDNETIAIVPQGKALSFGGARAASSAPQITIISAPQFDLSGAVMTPQLMREVDRVSRQHAANAAAAMGQGVMKAVPARIMQYQSDGL